MFFLISRNWDYCGLGQFYLLNPHLVEEEADDVDVAGLGGEVERRVALVVRQVVVDERHLLQQQQHLHHPVAAQVRHRRLQRRNGFYRVTIVLWTMFCCFI